MSRIHHLRAAGRASDHSAPLACPLRGGGAAGTGVRVTCCGHLGRILDFLTPSPAATGQALAHPVNRVIRVGTRSAVGIGVAWPVCDGGGPQVT